MNNKKVENDERTNFIENISYKFGYNFITFALLFDAIYRSLKINDPSYDLLAIIIVGYFVMIIYQYKQKILGKTWIKSAVFRFFIAFIFAFFLMWIMKKF